MLKDYHYARRTHQILQKKKNAIAMKCGLLSQNVSFIAFSDYLEWLLDSLDVGGPLPLDEYELPSLSTTDLDILNQQLVDSLNERYKAVIEQYYNFLTQALWCPDLSKSAQLH